ncbi:MAG: protein kinase domain-containing protein [Planctomycetota bacterium]|jgi:tetratricopeptide (TPR) repeat protein
MKMQPANAPSVPGFQILEKLGSGGMATVWKARNREGLLAAIKIIDRLDSRFNATARQYFRREALACLNLNHPSLVRALDVGETEEGKPYIALEYIEGSTLWQHITAKGPLPEREAVRIGLMLASGLDHAHRLGVLHRDIKPENVMLLQEGGVKLVDFGLVVEAGKEEQMVCGTAGYVSPEAILEGKIEPASDLFSLGMTLAFAVLGKHPFSAETQNELLYQTIGKPFALPSRVGKFRLSRGFRAVIERLTRKKAEERYHSAAELVLDLEEVKAGDNPLGAMLSLGGLKRSIRQRRGKVFVGAASGIVLLLMFGVWALVGGLRRETVILPPPLPPPASPDAFEAKVKAVLIYLDRHPTDFAEGRKLLADIQKKPLTEKQRARIREAESKLEERFDTLASSLLEDRKNKARHALAQGDLDGVTRILSSWPKAFRRCRAAEEARRTARLWKEEALAPAEALFRELQEHTARWKETPPRSPKPVRDLLDKLDRFLKDRPPFPGQNERLAPFRVMLVRRWQTLVKAAQAERARELWRMALQEAVRAGDPGKLDRTLPTLLPESCRKTDTAKLLSVVRVGSQRAERLLAARLAGLVGKPWAGHGKNRLFVGIVPSRPETREVFLPRLAEWKEKDRTYPSGLDDLLALVRDPDDLSAWLLLSARPDLCNRVGSPKGAARQLLAQSGGIAPPPAIAPKGIWVNLQARMPLTLRDPNGPLPPASSSTSDPLLSSWEISLRAARGDEGARRALASRPKENPAKEEALESFLSDASLKAWSSLEEAAKQDPLDAEVAVLRGRILWLLAKPLPTTPVVLMALSEARRAWDLDRELPAAPRLVAEIIVGMRGTRVSWRSGEVDALGFIAAEAAIRLGQNTPEVCVLLGMRCMASGKRKEAVDWLQRARKAAPRHPLVLIELARAQIGAGQEGAGRKTLEEARRILGADFPAWAGDLRRHLRR